MKRLNRKGEQRAAEKHPPLDDLHPVHRKEFALFPEARAADPPEDLPGQCLRQSRPAMDLHLAVPPDVLSIRQPIPCGEAANFPSGACASGVRPCICRSFPV